MGLFGKKDDVAKTIDPDELRRLGLQMLEMMDPVLETLDGYKAKLVERGYSETAAEMMAVDLHHVMIRGSGS